MKLGLAQRQAALAGIALLAAVVALAISSDHHHSSALPPPVGTYSALAASSGVVAYGKHTACGQVLGPTTEGVSQPVLPCGVKLYVNFRGKHVLTEVIDHGPNSSGTQFELTQALAQQLGLVGVQRIVWSYAEAQ